MQIHELIQGSDEWKAFRDKHIGASDSASILDISPWMTKYDLWMKKTGRAEDQRATPAMMRGNDLEETVRQIYESETGELIMPRVVSSSEHPFMIASLDGITSDNKVIVEIKCPRKEVFDLASMGQVVPYYYCQMQHQLACVPEATRVDYVVYWNDRHIIMPVERDEDYIADLIEKERDFYENNILQDIPPEAEVEDYVKIEDEEFQVLEMEYERQEKLLAEDEKALKEDKKKLDLLKQKLLDFTDDGNCVGNVYRFTKKYRQGYDYKQACVDEKIDMKKYFKPTIRWEIKKL